MQRSDLSRTRITDRERAIHSGRSVASDRRAVASKRWKRAAGVSNDVAENRSRVIAGRVAERTTDDVLL